MVVPWAYAEYSTKRYGLSVEIAYLYNGGMNKRILALSIGIFLGIGAIASVGFYYYKTLYASESIAQFQVSNISNLQSQLFGTQAGYLTFKPGTYTLDSSISIPSNLKSFIGQDVIFKLDPGTTLKFEGAVEFSGVKNRIFFGSSEPDKIGTVWFSKNQKVAPEWWGAAGGDSTDDTTAIQNAVNSVVFGGTVAPTKLHSGTFKISDNLTIAKSDITLDFLNNNIESAKAVRIYCNGDLAAKLSRYTFQSEREANMLNNCVIKNIKIGKDDNNRMAGPHLIWCKNCKVENVVKTGPTGTGFNTYACVDCQLNNITNTGNKATKDRASIGVLIHMSDRTVINGAKIENGAFTSGIQIKGGDGNRIENSSFKNLAAIEGETDYIAAINIRGDAPWKASQTARLAGEEDRLNQFTYRYGVISQLNLDSPWLQADTKRASHNTLIKNVKIENLAPVTKNGETSSQGVGIRVQESVDTTISDVTIDYSWIAIALHRISSGSEKGFTIKNVKINNAFARGISFVDGNPTSNSEISVDILNSCISGKEGFASVYRNLKTIIFNTTDVTKSAPACTN